MGKAQVPPLIPGLPVAPTAPLARYRSPSLRQCVRTALEATTEPGDLVLELGVSDAVYTREILDIGRRALALNVNPIPLLWTQVALNPPALIDVQAALTRMGDSPKGSRPLIAHVRDLYRSRCPKCQSSGVAEWFAWDRDAQRPFTKRVRCSRCETAQEGPVETADLDAVERFVPRAGPAYHIALGRAAPADDPLHERAAELVALYTPRNLSVLMDCIHRVSQASADTNVQRMLTLLLIEALDQGSSLVPYGEPLIRPRSLRPPQRFLEYNVWLLMERTLQAYSERQSPLTSFGAPVDSLRALLDSAKSDYLLLAHPMRSVAQVVNPKSIAAVILQPQQPDAVFWALSALWAGWLWKEDVNPAMRAFLGRRRLDWEWYRRSLVTTLNRVTPLLTPDAPVLGLLPDDNPTMLAHVVAALAESKLHLEQWIGGSPWGYRFACNVAHGQRRSRPATGDTRTPAESLQRRGEPATVNFLSGLHLIQSGANAPTQLESLPLLTKTSALTHVTSSVVWLSNPAQTARPLADRVEERVLRLLQSQEHWERTALEVAVYEQFPAELSPEPELVRACIDAYTTPEGERKLTLRPEDQSNTRGAEARQMRALLRRLGENLEFQITQSEENDIVWVDEEHPLYWFRLTTTALLGPHLLTPQPPISGRRCLVLPGGRAALVALKLRRDPRLQRLIEQHNWVFIKFRHLRRMAAEVQHRGVIEVYLGLDPIVEQEQVQIPLPWK